MTLLKFITISILLISITVAWNFPSRTSSKQTFPTIAGHDLIVGSRLPGDKLIHKEHVVKNGKWFQIVTVTKKIDATRGDKITQIIAKDQVTDGTGAYAKVVSGGPSYNDVSMKFTSQRGYGINFILEVYAR